MASTSSVAGPERFVNRELSWLDFDQRVLAIALDEATPLLDRVKFLAIAHSNLDEFFEVRVAGLREQVHAGVATPFFDGLTPQKALRLIRQRVLELYRDSDSLFHDQLRPLLAAEGIHFTPYAELDADDREYLGRQFRERVFPVLTPLAVDPAHPFPYISNKSLNLAVFVRAPHDRRSRFARVKIPPILPRFVVLPDGVRIVPLESVIAAHLDELFPGTEVVAHHTFRVTRDADLDIGELGDDAEDLLEEIENRLTRQRFGNVVRLEVEDDINDEALSLLMRELNVDEIDVYRSRGPLDMRGLFAVAEIDRPELRWQLAPGVTPRAFEEPDIFAALRERDLLVQHPYDSFQTTVSTFIARAARDPEVLAIKQTLYRTATDSSIVNSLILAAEEGKQVVALVELKARFDEEANIEWARRLEEAGVHVMYGVVGLKTHTKTTLVVRREGDVVRRYAHVGTGNYHEKTARLYEDVGIFTANPDIGADLTDLFNYLTGYSFQRDYRQMLVAPLQMRERIVDLILAEAAHDDGRIVMKMNSLVDPGIIDALYEASLAGVRIDLIVRGICCLRPGVPGLSDNITVRSVVGRYLEHSRIYRFGTKQRGRRYYIGSADMMPRNLDRRVEAIAPVLDPVLKDRLEDILDVLREDDVNAWQLDAEATWSKVPTVEGLNAHLVLNGEAARHAQHPELIDNGVPDLVTEPTEIRAAGGLITRERPTGTEVLVAHRPRYDDWSLPKGKLDEGETYEEAALREVEEETGLRCALDAELPPVRYLVDGQPKLVRYWHMSVIGVDDPRPGDDEVDELRWVPVADALALLSYPHDRDLVSAWSSARH